ncbi:MFS transporter [Corynebacterium sp. sy039]|uniref:MFS transporter n=1 Tax=Corynebacterium sp. sy039 TaxID=2599641 RepID=UPI0011B40AE1|nr:MFS transporter [Corynebacterium sp. sy039]QDZ42213.1 MFS transporter [Corynebacterium sp. sy039]
MERMKNPRVVAFIAIILSALNLRTMIVALPPLMPHISQELGFNTTTIGILGTLPTIMFAVSAFAVPHIMRFLNIPQALCVAMLITGLGQFFRVIGPNPVFLFLGTGCALFAIGMGNTILPLASREFFPEKVPTINTTYLFTMQITMGLAPVVVGLESMPGWQLTLGMWGILGIAAAAAWLPLARIRRPRTPQHKQHSKNDTGKKKANIPVWKTKVGWGLAFMLGCTSFVTYTLIAFIPQIYVEAGMSKQFAATMLGIWSFTGIILNASGPWLVGRFNSVFIFVVISGACSIVGTLGLVFATNSAPVLWVIISGLGPLSFPMSLTLIDSRARTMQGATSLSSFMQGIGYTIASLGPFCAGLLHDIFHDFHAASILTASFTVMMIVGGYFATRQVFVEDQLARRLSTSPQSA